MGLNVRIYDIVSDGPYSIRYKIGSNPWPEYDNTTFTLYGTGLTATTIELTGLTFDTQYWIKMTDQTTGRYIIKNIYTHDSKAFPCYDTICFSVEVVCEEGEVSPTQTPTQTLTSTPTNTPTQTPTQTSTPTLTECSDDIVRTLSVAPRIAKSIQTDELNDLVYVVAYSGTTNTSVIYAITPNTPTITQVYSGLNHARYSTLNTTNNKLYVTGNQVIYVFDVSLGNFSLLTTITGTAGHTYAGGLVYNSSNNKIYAHSSTGVSTSELTIIDGSTDTITTTLTGLPFRNANNGLVNSEFMECVPSNNKIYIAGNTGTVKVFDCTTNTVTNSITLPADYASTMTYKPSTNQLFAFFESFSTDDGYSIINCTTETVVSSHTSSSFNLTFSAKYNSANNRIYTANYVSGISILDTATNLITSTPITTSVMSVELYEPTNTIYISNTVSLDYAVYEICGENVATPTQTPTSTPTSTPTQTLTSTPTQTLTSTPTQTLTETPTSTPTSTPTNTPTQTQTSTMPTEPIGTVAYEAEKWSCGYDGEGTATGCTLVDDLVIVEMPTSISPSFGRFYVDVVGGCNGFVYMVTGNSTGTGVITLYGTNAWIDCVDACQESCQL